MICQFFKIEQHLCSIARFGGTKIPHKFKKRRCYDDAQKFFGKDATKLNIKINKRSFKVDKITAGDFIRTAQMMKKNEKVSVAD